MLKTLEWFLVDEIQFFDIEVESQKIVVLVFIGDFDSDKLLSFQVG